MRLLLVSFENPEDKSSVVRGLIKLNEPKIIRRISDDDKTTRVSDKRPFCFKIAEELIWGIF